MFSHREESTDGGLFVGMMGGATVLTGSLAAALNGFGGGPDLTGTDIEPGLGLAAVGFIFVFASWLIESLVLLVVGGGSGGRGGLVEVAGAVGLSKIPGTVMFLGLLIAAIAGVPVDDDPAMAYATNLLINMAQYAMLLFGVAWAHRVNVAQAFFMSIAARFVSSLAVAAMAFWVVAVFIG